MKNKFSTDLFCALLLTLIFAVEAQSEIVVEIDISDISAVTFTTTEALSEVNFAGSSANGIALQDFFVGNSTTASGENIGSTISAFNAADGSSRLALDRIWINNFVGGYTTNDVSFYNASAVETIFTIEDQRALTGAAVFDLTTFTGLPSFGTVGNVYFDAPAQSQVIGQWRVTAVPEPSAGIVLAVGTLVLLRRKRC
jgi:hypothetical protein